MEKVEKLRAIILENLEDFQGNSLVAPFNEVPDFDLYSHDYLEFAEQELNKGTSVSLVNCITHLKRSIECQMDTFFYTFNLAKLFSRRNLKFDKKADFLKEAGVLISRSLSRFNTIRNKIEHEYRVPKIDDIEVYFDLVSALVLLVERATFQYTGVDFFAYDENNDKKITFKMTYRREAPSIEATWRIVIDGEEKEEKLEVYAEREIQEFAHFFRILTILIEFWNQQGSIAYIRRKLSQ
ncbi:MAG: hypothetical protein KME25_13160 [Symplocastrum torsivum CPER-KK1]|jgi:hypothetical protein|uniref:Uncharacterized protein n=1 Tax=Symplocastrum torsivum CPER-KK1 TaxID=450513 RepID=A0A951PMC7_9CYAN|nr:hypothetical protein [Symplocastrum torsivum CPER-KK1]